MKKLLLVLLSTCLLSFKTNEEKLYKVELTLKQWQAVLEIIDQSNAPHLHVKEVQDFLVIPLNKQIDTTKNK